MSSNTQEYTERLQHWARISFSPQQHNSVAQSRLVKHLAPAFFFYFVSRWLFAALQPASASRCLFAMAPTASILLIGAPASHKPHSAEKSTPVWLALWRIWAGFANSQLRCANFPALIYVYASIPVTATLEPLLRQTQIFRSICTDCLRHLRISAK